MGSDSYTAPGLLSLPTEVILQLLLAVDEPWAIHHTAKLFLAISEDEHYLYLRDTSLPLSLIVWNAIKRRGPRLTPEYLQRLLDFGASVPIAFAQLLTNPRIPRPAPARALHATLAALPARTRALIVAAHIRVPSLDEPVSGFVWDALIHDDDQRVFESLFGAPSNRIVSASARALFDARGFVPFCGGRNDTERGVGSLEGAFDVAFKCMTQTPPNPSLLSALLSSTTISTLISTDERDLKSRLLVNAFAIAGTQCAARLMQERAFWRPRLDVVEALLKLAATETDINDLMQVVTAPSPVWPPAPHNPTSLASPLLPASSFTSADRNSHPGLSCELEHTISTIAQQLLARIGARAQAEDGAAWFLKYHMSLGRIYAYYNRIGEEGGALCVLLESMACAAVHELFDSKRAAKRRYEGTAVSETSTAWTLCERFGPRTREKVLSAVRAQVEQLLHDRSVLCEAPRTFAEWGMHAYLIARLDPQDRRRVLAGVKGVDVGPAGIGSDSGSDDTRRRLLKSGLPLAVLEPVA
ncbi:Ecl1 domain protein [Ceratobasidium sp. AG-Ba]|nr:Ecl1 domain protein [Ceratobasidium sp. AG-Ba]